MCSKVTADCGISKINLQLRRLHGLVLKKDVSFFSLLTRLRPLFLHYMYSRRWAYHLSFRLYYNTTLFRVKFSTQIAACTSVVLTILQSTVIIFRSLQSDERQQAIGRILSGRPIPAISYTHTATGSLNFPSCWIRYMRSPPLTNSITKYSRSYKYHGKTDVCKTQCGRTNATDTDTLTAILYKITTSPCRK